LLVRLPPLKIEAGYDAQPVFHKVNVFFVACDHKKKKKKKKISSAGNRRNEPRQMLETVKEMTEPAYDFCLFPRI
jgi:hypothetical protein